MKRIGILFSLLISLVLANPTQAAAQEIYVALGDSIAAGQTPYLEIDQGYTDLIAAELARTRNLAFFSKDLAFPGFTTDQVYESIQSDEAKKLLKTSTLITISAGANDLLRVVNANPERGTLSYQQTTADFALNGARKSLEKLLSELKVIAPQAKIYVMGYYFAYPHAADFEKEGTRKELVRLNQLLEQTAKKNGAVYVSVEEKMNTALKSYVPNPSDVHPVQEGYRQIANSFFAAQGSSLSIEPYEMPVPNPLSFEEIQQLQDNETTSNQTAHIPKNGLALARIIPLA